MTAFLNSTPPPRHWLSRNLTTTWLRLGKAAVFTVLAGLAVAGGLAFPGGDAAAQGAQGGYTYTERVCQEYGQQPRWYNVRDGQAAYNGGNSDSGWLIVLISSANSRTIHHFAFYGWFNAHGAQYHADDPADGVAPRRYTNIYTGVSAFQRFNRDTNQWVTSGNNFVLDANNDGVLSLADGLSPGGGYGNHYYRVGTHWTSQEHYGGSYVRWAHMAWCR